MNSICISSGHGLYVRGASGILDEVDEARRVVDAVAAKLRHRGAKAIVFHDDVSTSQNENLNRIVDFHNAQTRELDVSVHFNAYEQRVEPVGTECLYLTQSELAGQMSSAIAAAGQLIDRGGKKESGLFFLNNTAMPSILIEVCFVDSEADADLYRAHFESICDAITGALHAPSVVKPPNLVRLTGRVSWFGGPQDTGVSSDEGLAFIYEVEQAPHLFLPHQPPGTTGLARRLNPHVPYLATRWDYDHTSKEELLDTVALVRALKTGRTARAFPADWGPHEDTGRIADISPGLMKILGIATDDEVEVIFPWKEA